MELIDKAALVAEIERLIEINKGFKKTWKWKFKWFYRTIIGRLEAFEGLKIFLDTLEVKETGTVWHSFDEVLPPQGSDICVYWDRDEIITTGIWEESEKPKYASKWAYTDDLLQKPTNPFDSHIQEGDKITVNEDGSRFNRSQLERVVELSRYSKPDEAKRVKRTPADTEAAMKEIDELSKAFTEAHPEGGDQMLREIRGEHHIVDNNEMVSEELEEAATKYAQDKYMPVQTAEAFRAGYNKCRQEMMNSAIEREVKVDAGGYPYIDATELYDYDNDKPLAKAGDKIKVVFIKDK